MNMFMKDENEIRTVVSLKSIKRDNKAFADLALVFIFFSYFYRTNWCSLIV